jgi:hypothetical protein
MFLPGKSSNGKVLSARRSSNQLTQDWMLLTTPRGKSGSY